MQRFLDTLKNKYNINNTHKDFIVKQVQKELAKKNNIPITTFMIASDPYLQTFVKKFSEVNNGKAFYTGLDGLSEMIFEDYETNRKKRI